MMKILKPFLLSIALLVPAGAQENDVAPDENIPAWQQAFLNLPEDTRADFDRHVAKARELFAQKRIFETIEELHAARKIYPDSPDVENLLGACKVEFRAFKKAMEHFERANALSPRNPSVLFNIAEVQFVTKQWADARRYFERVLALTEAEGSKQSLYHLTEFKLMLCLIQLGEMDQAREYVDKYDFMDDTPFPYYAEAAIAYHGGDELKAEAAIARAARVFRNPQLLSPWQDTLMEFGYIKSFYGGDLPEEQ